MRHFLYSDRVALEREVLQMLGAAYPVGFRLSGLTPVTVAKWLASHADAPRNIAHCLRDLSTIFLHLEYNSLSGFEREVQKRQRAARIALAQLKCALEGES